MHFSKRKFTNFILLTTILIVHILLLFNFKEKLESTTFVKTSVLSSFVLFVLELVYICKENKNAFNPTFLFLLSFYFFQNGQLLLYALGIDFNDFYINTLKQHLINVCLFSSISAIIAGYSGIICQGLRINNRDKEYAVDKYNKDSLHQAMWLGFLVTAIVAVPLVLIKMYYAIGGGYSAVRIFEGQIPSIINFIEYMFMPFSVLYLSYFNQENTKMVKIITIIWLLLTSLCGDRTTGISGLLILFYLNYIKTTPPKKKNNSNIFKIILVSLFLIIFVRVAYLFRTQNEISVSSFFDYHFVSGFISEIGFSCFPLFTMMNTVPYFEPYLKGKGYLQSLIGGLIPSFVDPTGTIKTINSQSRIFESWQTMYFKQYSFGFGFSLNAEAYINFGWYGLIAIFIICIIVLSFLKNKNLKIKKDGWELYTTSILLFLWFTLPRRDSYYIWKAISYSIIIVRLYLYVMCKNKNVERRQK